MKRGLEVEEEEDHDMLAGHIGKFREEWRRGMRGILGRGVAGPMLERIGVL